MNEVAPGSYAPGTGHGESAYTTDSSVRKPPKTGKKDSNSRDKPREHKEAGSSKAKHNHTHHRKKKTNSPAEQGGSASGSRIDPVSANLYTSAELHKVLDILCVNLEDWSHSQQPVLDLRPAESFRRRRLRNSVNIPWMELSSRCFELPPREVGLSVVFANPLLNGNCGAGDYPMPPRYPKEGTPEGTGAKHEAESGDTSEDPVPTVETQQGWFLRPRSAWHLVYSFVESELLWKLAAERGLLVEGEPTLGELRNRCVLWQPSPFVRKALPLVQLSLPKLRPDANIDSGGDYRCLDLGCGSGRDAVFCAMRGFRVKAVDNWKGALQRAQALADRYKDSFCSEDAVEFFEMDLKGATVAELQEQIGCTRVHLLVISRFLPRSLLFGDDFWTLIETGGWLVFSHFMIGCLEFGRPSQPEDMLTESEVEQLCSIAGLECKLLEYTTLHDGRPIVNIALQRVSEAAADPPAAAKPDGGKTA
mmetsp:Transcript_9509/g.34860  ORF Transcript_9509/g.34860 Transcript_9509/m.34860 type:complete len:477 (-) Transcript_9509:33-1463(-)